MENTLVSARVPKAKKERGVGVLAAIGATTSDLINSAFDYVIEYQALPGAGESAPRDARAFDQFVGESTLAVEWPRGFDGDYKRLERDMMVSAYEALG